MQIALSVFGMILCSSWYDLISSYKNINDTKFKVIHEIEKELPLSPYKAEYIEQSKKPHNKFTDIEMKVPWIFYTFYFAGFSNISYSLFFADFSNILYFLFFFKL